MVHQSASISSWKQSFLPIPLSFSPLMVLQSCDDAFKELRRRKCCFIEDEMTDVKVEARLSYCHGRQPRLQGCQSELVGGGLWAVIPAFRSRPTYQVTGAVQALGLCRIKHTKRHTQLNLHTYMHAVQTLMCLLLHIWVTNCHRQIFSAENKDRNKSRIKFARISVIKRGGKGFSPEMTHSFWKFLN